MFHAWIGVTSPSLDRSGARLNNRSSICVGRLLKVADIGGGELMVGDG